MKKHLFKIVFSFLAVIIFLLIGVGYIGLWSENESKTESLGNGIYKETSIFKGSNVHSAESEVTDVYIGPKDELGKWNGQVTHERIVDYKSLGIEKFTYVNGRLHGKCWERRQDYNNPQHIYLELVCYNMDKVVPCNGNLASNISDLRSSLSAVEILELKYPLFLFENLPENQNIRDSVKLFMTAIEKKLNTYTLNNDNFDTYFNEVDGSIDSFSGYSNWYQFSGRFASGENEAKDFEFRRAVIERYTKTKLPVADIIQVRYPYFKDQLEKEFGATSAAFKTFCTEFDTKMDKKINIPVGDPFFIDSLDSWMGQIFSDYMNDDNNLIYAKLKILFSQSIKSATSRNGYDLSPQSLVSEYLESSLTDTLPVHEAILTLLFTKVLEADAVKRSIKEACLTAQKVPILPEIVTNILSENMEGVKVRGLIVFDGNDPITKSGIVWDTVFNPELTPNNIINTSNKYDFTAVIKGLVKGKTYFVRSYAVNKAGIAYGNTMEFKPGSVSSNKDLINEGVDWKIYPNPADDQISITLKETIPVVDVSVYSMSGHKIFIKRYNQIEEINIVSKDWPSGTYNIVLNGSNFRKTKKVVIQR
ncbi:MAG: T9SS type A sorting domain-containing protein [Saprospiraceae bacterium]|jgi:hypothetical protein|nr:T9SS type A sorting domain-containing protein [Saprospiraceae bacterium]